MFANDKLDDYTAVSWARVKGTLYNKQMVLFYKDNKKNDKHNKKMGKIEFILFNKIKMEVYFLLTNMDIKNYDRYLCAFQVKMSVNDYVLVNQTDLENYLPSSLHVKKNKQYGRLPL